MSDLLTDFPESLVDEYSGLAPVRQTSTACVYRARDGLNAPVLITEAFETALCQRDLSGGVSARPDCAQAWAERLDIYHKRISAWSRLVHPALCGIDQVFRTNGTLYTVTREVEGQSLDRLLPDVTAILEPHQIKVAAESLIDLLDHLHAFGIFGLGIEPKSLLLDDQEATLFLSLQPYLEGSIAAPADASSSVASDGGTLAHTLHCLLTGAAPEHPYKPLHGRLGKDVPAPLISTLDVLLGPEGPQTDFSARNWKSQISKTPGKRTSLRRWRPLAAAVALLILGFAAWLGISVLIGPASISGSPSQNYAIPDAGPWQLDLPLEIVQSGSAEGSFVLKLTSGSAEFMALNPWVQDGLTVTRVNDAPVISTVDLRALAVSSAASPEAAELTSLTVQDPNLPLQNTVAVVPHVWRQKTYGAIQLREQAAIQGWQLSVMRVDAGVTLPLKVGDVLVRDQVADLDLNRFTDFERLLHHLERMTNPSLTLMIRRQDNSELVVGFAAERLLANRTAVSEQ